jgi:hypothetical protein
MREWNFQPCECQWNARFARVRWRNVGLGISVFRKDGLNLINEVWSDGWAQTLLNGKWSAADPSECWRKKDKKTLIHTILSFSFFFLLVRFHIFAFSSSIVICLMVISLERTENLIEWSNLFGKQSLQTDQQISILWFALRTEIRASVEIIGEEAFNCCYSLSEVVFQANRCLGVIQEFRRCFPPCRLEIPSAMELTEWRAFLKCFSLQQTVFMAVSHISRIQPFRLYSSLSRIGIRNSFAIFNSRLSTKYEE